MDKKKIILINSLLTLLLSVFSCGNTANFDSAMTHTAVAGWDLPRYKAQSNSTAKLLQ